MCQNLAGTRAEKLADVLGPSQFKATFSVCLSNGTNGRVVALVPVWLLGPLRFSGLAGECLATISGPPSKQPSVSLPGADFGNGPSD